VVVRATILLLVAIGFSAARAQRVRVTEFVRFYVVWGALLAFVLPLAVLVIALATGYARWPSR
jgi:hypothetical protein